MVSFSVRRLALGTSAGKPAAGEVAVSQPDGKVAGETRHGESFPGNPPRGDPPFSQSPETRIAEPRRGGLVAAAPKYYFIPHLKAIGWRLGREEKEKESNRKIENE